MSIFSCNEYSHSSLHLQCNPVIHHSSSLPRTFGRFVFDYRNNNASLLATLRIWVLLPLAFQPLHPFLAKIASRSNLIYIFRTTSTIGSESTMRQYQSLVMAAREVRVNSYAPFSKFKVGAALLAQGGRIFTGCNVENSSFGLTMCAERAAIFRAIAEGARKFKAIAIVTNARSFTPPCGACRQVLSDLAGNIDIVMANSKNRLKVVKLRSLLPLTFTGKSLNSRKQFRKN
jgi:cytidine deaminase